MSAIVLHLGIVAIAVAPFLIANAQVFGQSLTSTLFGVAQHCRTEGLHYVCRGPFGQHAIFWLGSEDWQSEWLAKQLVAEGGKDIPNLFVSNYEWRSNYHATDDGPIWPAEVIARYGGKLPADRHEAAGWKYVGVVKDDEGTRVYFDGDTSTFGVESS